MLNIYKTDSKSGFLKNYWPKPPQMNLHWCSQLLHNCDICTTLSVSQCSNCHNDRKNFFSRLAFSFFLKQSLRATPRICNDLEGVFNTTVCGLSLPVYGSRSSVSHTASRCPPNRQNQVSQTQNWNFSLNNRRLLCRNSHLWIRYNIFVISSHKNTTIECSFHVSVTTAANRYYCPT